MNKIYKAGRPRYSTFYGYEVVDILKRTKILWIFNVWTIYDTVKNCGQIEDLVYLHNYPEEMKKRIKETCNKITQNDKQRTQH